MQRVDVVVVGAGFAGLTAARRLQRAGVSVIVLEADDRVGGRTMPGRLAGRVVDLGGQWVAPDHTRLISLAREFGVEAYPQYVDGNNIYDLGGQRGTYKLNDTDLPATSLKAVQETVNKLTALATSAFTVTGDLGRHAAGLDGGTLESWLLANVFDRVAYSYFRLMVRATHSAETYETSLLAFVSLFAGENHFEHMTSVRGGAQDSVFDGGVWQLADRMAKELGTAVILGSPVRHILQDDQGVTVRSDQGDWRGRYVVVTAPPTMANRIQVTPPLSSQRDACAQRSPLGNVIKVHLAYSRPFWRDQGLSGQVLSDQTDFGPWFDHSPRKGGSGALVGFYNGATAHKWADRDPIERRMQCLQDVAKYFGTAALSPTDYIEEVWGRSAFHRGGYGTVSGPGVITTFHDALREPVGRIHWAGTETDADYSGYIEGAIRSGENAAAALRKLV
ncbi:hypothetical protein ASE00_21930 [Sphingomonas sp. Root710]|uniref:flavin monoamine oxidase family protein n=1 Tax=Sphingomonas sp. Root710 TaxID=1736594 RepID=UPI0006FF5277|nr:flavin monoamine oxidase family protein [Sphingomonas sp. Root710]KRB84887.1 hypothetical protein ASE00_21930 [Sphingomonas sp. Root710]